MLRLKGGQGHDVHSLMGSYYGCLWCMVLAIILVVLLVLSQ